MSDIATQLLKVHSSGEIAFHLANLDPTEDSLALLVQAYNELKQHGLVEELTQIVVPFHGATPRRAYRLTSTGLKYKLSKV